MSKYCPECGTEHSKEVKFCVNCGKSFRGRVSTSKNIKRKEPKLHHLKEKVNKWKEEGYKVDELERMISSIGNVKLDRKEIMQITAISISIAIALVCITFVIGNVAVINQINQPRQFNIDLGFPLSWLNIHNSQISELSLEVSNWLNLIINFILYVALVFGISYTAETILKGGKYEKKV